MSMRVGHIVRHEDESGISGTGIVAEWVEYSDGEVVVHWLSHTPSTNHYRNFKQVDKIHGHGGKTELIVIWEQPLEINEANDNPEENIEVLFTPLEKVKSSEEVTKDTESLKEEEELLEKESPSKSVAKRIKIQKKDKGKTKK